MLISHESNQDFKTIYGFSGPRLDLQPQSATGEKKTHQASDNMSQHLSCESCIPTVDTPSARAPSKPSIDLRDACATSAKLIGTTPQILNMSDDLDHANPQAESSKDLTTAPQMIPKPRLAKGLTLQQRVNLEQKQYSQSMQGTKDQGQQLLKQLLQSLPLTYIGAQDFVAFFSNSVIPSIIDTDDTAAPLYPKIRQLTQKIVNEPQFLNRRMSEQAEDAGNGSLFDIELPVDQTCEQSSSAVTPENEAQSINAMKHLFIAEIHSTH